MWASLGQPRFGDQAVGEEGVGRARDGLCRLPIQSRKPVRRLLAERGPSAESQPSASSLLTKVLASFGCSLFPTALSSCLLGERILKMRWAPVVEDGYLSHWASAQTNHQTGSAQIARTAQS
jgi:hypothetical protein